MKHRKVTSDLKGLKCFEDYKNKSFSNGGLGSVGKLNRTFSTCDSGSFKSIQSPETPKKNDLNKMVSTTFKLLDHFYREKDIVFFQKAEKYLKNGWLSHKRALNEHQNKIFYIEQSMQKRSYSQIEGQVVKEWRKNPLLYYLRSAWYEAIAVTQFQDFGDFLNSYHLQCEFVAQIGYLFFKGFFTTLSQNLNGSQIIVQKLTVRTSQLILTDTNTWCKLYDKKLKRLLKYKLNIEQPLLGDKFDIKSLNISPFALNLESQEIQTPKTSDAIARFTFESRILEKKNLLIEVRSTLEQQILDWQKNVIRQGKLAQHKILDKDDFIGCLIYAVVKGQIPLTQLGISVKLFRFFFDDQNEVLAKWGVDSYLADLQSVFDYLIYWAPESKTLETMDISI